MYHADLVGGLAAKAAGNPPVVWNIRHTLSRATDVKRNTLLVARANAALSGWVPTRIVCCASAALESHASLGYRRDRMVIIPNGFDLQAIQPDPVARVEVRRQLGFGSNTPVIGMCGRFDAQKDHENFIHAAGLLHKHMPAAHFVLWGDGITADNQLLWKWVVSEGLQENVHLLGYRAESPRLNCCLDIGTLSSAYGEAFPNVVGEAMACGVPCVVTDVGDSAYIVGPTGVAVPPRDPQALAQAWAGLLERPEQERQKLGREARQRVSELFNITQVAQAYASLYQDIISKPLAQ
jgi:glycosyltransferase involved in cell wall biosynthesis